MVNTEKPRQSETIILGVDPGTSIMGYGLIKVVEKQASLLNFGVITLSKYDSHEQRLKIIFDRISGIMAEYMPDFMAIEAPFFGKNVQSMLKLGRAQGVAIAAALNRDIPYIEYAPKRIKQSITGSGSASKEQVAGMLQSILKIKEMPKHLDATDGLAAAMCYFFEMNSPLGAPGKTSWKSFISKNPGRVS